MAEIPYQPGGAHGPPRVGARETRPYFDTMRYPSSPGLYMGRRPQRPLPVATSPSPQQSEQEAAADSGDS
eukprot:9301390-Pyramimonas_sp.AAC.1